MAPKQRPDSNAKASSPGKKELPNPDEYVNCMCFEVYLKRCDGTWVTKSDGTYETKRFMAPRDIEFPDLCEKLAATFPGDLRMRRKKRGGNNVIKSNFEVAYHGRQCRLCNTYETPSLNLVVFDTFSLRSALVNGYKFGCKVSPDELLVVGIICTVRGGMCTIL